MPDNTQAGMLRVARARSIIGSPVRYHLGAGGRYPGHASPVDSSGACDCSGCQAWVLGRDRYMPEVPFYKKENGGWFETTAICKDALSGPNDGGLLKKVADGDHRIGDFVAYPDHKDSAGNHHEGHIGLVSKVESGKYTDVIDCSSRNPVGHAMQEHAATVFLSNPASVVMRPNAE